MVFVVSKYYYIRADVDLETVTVTNTRVAAEAAFKAAVIAFLRESLTAASVAVLDAELATVNTTIMTLEQFEEFIDGLADRHPRLRIEAELTGDKLQVELHSRPTYFQIDSVPLTRNLPKSLGKWREAVLNTKKRTGSTRSGAIRTVAAPTAPVQPLDVSVLSKYLHSEDGVELEILAVAYSRSEINKIAKADIIREITEELDSIDNSEFKSFVLKNATQPLPVLSDLITDTAEEHELVIYLTLPSDNNLQLELGPDTYEYQVDTVPFRR